MAEYRWRWAGLTVLLIAEAMILLDATIVQVAGPVIHRELVGPATDIQWFSAAFTLPFAVLLIVGGRLGDIAGRRRLLQLGIAGFVLASVWCAVAGSAGELITARVVQGAAAAVLIPQTIGLIRRMFAGTELPRARGTIGPVMGLTSMCGPPLGGLLTQADLFAWSWRVVFLVNVPLGLGVWLAAPLLPEDRAESAPRLDLGGTALVALGVGLLVYPIIGGGRWWLLAVGVVVLALFGVTQRRAARTGRPVLLEPSLFVGSGFAAALASSALFFGVTTGLMLVVVLQVQLGQGADAQIAGLTVLPWTGAMAVTSWLAGARLIPRHGAKVMFAGLGALLLGVLAACGCYLARPGALPVALPVALLIVGCGAGLFAPAFFNAALHQVRPHEVGSAAGLLNAVQQLGATMGIALLGGVFLRATASPGAGSPAALACVVGVLMVVLTGLSSAVQLGMWRTGRTPARVG